MQLLELTLHSAAANIALDEALLEHAEYSAKPWECLRLWESTYPIVVMGRASKTHQEVHRTACDQRQIPILRRSSGGASIVAGPGCLMYALIFNLERRPHLRSIASAYGHILPSLASALEPLVPGARAEGTSDLVFTGAGIRKFSGNSLRYRRRNLLCHGTILYGFAIELISELLKAPPRQPGYRSDRSHEDFIGNIRTDGSQLRQRLKRCWGADEIVSSWPEETTRQLVARKFGRREWIFRH